MSYIGIPPFGQTVRTVTTITASASQTSFTPNGGYTVGYVDVYYNGVKLVAGVDFTASNGSTVVLTVGATANATVEIIAYGSVSLADSVRRSGDTFSGAVLFPNNVIHAANGNVGIGNTIPNAPLVVGSASGSFTNPLIQAAGNANSWIQINGQNLNNGNNASTDMVLARSDGTDTSGFIDIGINSNTYSQAGYSIMAPNSGYLFTNGGDLVLGTQTAHNVLFHTGNTTSASERMRIAANGNVGFGTSTPNWQLHIKGPGPYIAFEDTDGTANTVSTVTGYQSGAMYYDSDTNNIQSSSTTGHHFRVNGGTTIASILGTGVVDLPYGRIKFPASQNASSDANTLDDYEEGTYTPTVIVNSGTPSYNYASAYYTKIGRQVFGGGIIGIGNSASLTGPLRVSLPFTVVTTTNGYAGGTFADGSGWTYPISSGSSGNIYSVNWMFNNGSSFMTFTCAATTATEIPYTASGIANSWYIRFGFSYYTS